MFQRITISENTKQNEHLSYVFFKIVLLCNCAVLPMSVDVISLEAFAAKEVSEIFSGRQSRQDEQVFRRFGS